jgi:probable phosphoglycerate mutase
VSEADRRILLVRHGETEWSLSGRHTGRTDLPLTEGGREAARGLEPRLRDRELALVLTSPMSRARETARLAGFEHAEPIDDLREWDYGDYEGLTTEEIHERDPGWSIWRDGCPGGESPEQIAARADRALERARAAGGDALLFAHGHILRVLTARWLGHSPAEGMHFALDTATLSLLGYEHEIPAIWAWNSRP